MVQEHERALGGWQSEWPTLAALCETLGSAVEAMKEVAPGLAIDTDAIQANMDATEAAVFAERATFLLAERMGKRKAAAIVEKALAKGGSFIANLGQLERELADDKTLLGYSPSFVDRLLKSIGKSP
jgi:3-carboxy-cis,cis-muconate cycloisomerase